MNISQSTGLIYSVSGNVKALRYVLDCLKSDGIDHNHVYSLGNIIGYASYSKECIELSKGFGCCLAGIWEQRMTTRRMEDPLRKSAKITFKRLKKEIPKHSFKNYLKQVLQIAPDVYLANEVSLDQMSKFGIMTFSIWEILASEIGSKKIIFGGFTLPAVFRKRGDVEMVPVEREKVVKLDDSVAAVAIGSVGFSEYFMKGFVNYAIVKENEIKLCSRPFQFDPDDYYIFSL